MNKSFGGSGDLFDSIFLAYFLENKDLKQSIKKTKDMISKVLNYQIKLDDKASDINIFEIFKNLESKVLI
ncbi:hypothetical protein ANHYDRO_00862 [Anaerococcus hydrogenalis DSM 7454]|uniref:Pyridoxal kinase n=1 Tax=Anaerococcus hydrogenalis DSM 7454 TaxID=561177 RepID=B6W8N4_9FIRM|nr:hypothetical protein [Anaerococcus hydrogenalis]EEB36210.1 hypothetical protein ANHYDRO_00862 [Anaerococcus hydrogenalis DSM 7454]